MRAALPFLTALLFYTLTYLLLSVDFSDYLEFFDNESVAQDKRANKAATIFDGLMPRSHVIHEHAENPCAGLCSSRDVCQCDDGFYSFSQNITDYGLLDKVDQDLHNRQFPSNCSDKTLVVFEFSRMNYGFGAKMFWLSAILGLSYKRNWVLVTKENDHWPMFWGNCTHGWACSFQPISSCKEGDSPHQYVFNEFSPFVAELQQYVSQEGERPSHKLRYWVPPAYAVYGATPKWWRSQLLRFLFRPHPSVLADLHTIKRDLLSRQWPADRPVLGVHMRRGMDKLADIGALAGVVPPEDLGVVASRLGNIPPTVYMSQVEHINARFRQRPNLFLKFHGNFSDVFLATDEPSVIQDIQKYTATLNILYNMGEVRGVDYLSGQAQALDVIANLWLLSQCDAMVFTMSSCYGRLAYQLVLARNTQAFGVSLDCGYYIGP